MDVTKEGLAGHRDDRDHTKTGSVNDWQWIDPGSVAVTHEIFMSTMMWSGNSCLPAKGLIAANLLSIDPYYMLVVYRPKNMVNIAAYTIGKRAWVEG